jgi:hypothetical protein
VDVGGFAEPRKILCQCALSLLCATISTPPVRAWGVGKPQQLSDPNNENHYRKDNIPKKIQGMLRAENLWGA